MGRITEIRAQTMVELKAKIYAKHSRKREAGESQSKFLNEFYEVSVDYARNHYVAKPRPQTEGETNDQDHH